MIERTKKLFATLTVPTVALFMTACASVQDTGGIEEEEGTVVRVTNHNYNRVVVEALSGGIDHRLGEVETNGTDAFLLPEQVSLLDLRIMIDPIGPTDTFWSSDVSAGPGDIIDVTVGADLSLTSLRVS